tara:strand:- start:3937 stop:4233 length:297 start_codon:yes stop_codon:yes gene_type:complete
VHELRIDFLNIASVETCLRCEGRYSRLIKEIRSLDKLQEKLSIIACFQVQNNRSFIGGIRSEVQAAQIGGVIFLEGIRVASSASSRGFYLDDVGAQFS